MAEITGRVTKTTGSGCRVKLMSDGSEVLARVKGNFRIKGIRTTNPVAVGDIVQLQPAGEEFFITAVKPRHNYIIRKASNLSKESHILASNLDLAVLVATLREPVTTTTFIDRFLATAEAYSIVPVMLLNKSDMRRTVSWLTL
jgi:ribosome biogenesis GTPase